MEFLDLTDATDSEKREIQAILSASSNIPGLELPFELVDQAKSSVTDTNALNDPKANTVEASEPRNTKESFNREKVNGGRIDNVESSNCSVSSNRKSRDNSSSNHSGVTASQVTQNKSKAGKKQRFVNKVLSNETEVLSNGLSNCDINGSRTSISLVNGADLSGKLTNGQTNYTYEVDASSNDAASYYPFNGHIDVPIHPMPHPPQYHPHHAHHAHHQQHHHQHRYHQQQQAMQAHLTPVTTIGQQLPHGHPVYPVVTPIPVITSMSSLAPYANGSPVTAAEVLQASVLRPAPGTNVATDAAQATGATVPFPFPIAANGGAPFSLPAVTTGAHGGQQAAFAAHTPSSHHHAAYHQPIYPSPYFPPPYHYVFLPFTHGPPHPHPHPHAHPHAPLPHHSHFNASAKMAPLPPQQFKHVCLGGTFDNVHEGHLRLLSQAIAIAAEKLTVGVTDSSMVSKKTLAELIRPIQARIEEITDVIGKMCKEQGKYLTINVVPISDPFGPAITDPTIEAIVVSQETVPGGHKINEIRERSALSPLEMITVDLIRAHSDKQVSVEEDKVSSSTARIRKLGTLLREPEERVHDAIPSPPYLIGLTGGIASGKSSIAAELAKLGAGVIDSDKMAHASYEKDSDTYKKIVNEFGSDILDADTQQIDRRKLGEKVFSSKASKDKLESIVWPATYRLVEKEMSRLFKQEKKQVIVLEASQLIEANWSSRVHQVWVVFVPEAEAIKRVVDRNNLSAEEAQKRVSSQMTNRDRLEHANVALCTLWDRSFTQAQVHKAWNMLEKRFLAK